MNSISLKTKDLLWNTLGSVFYAMVSMLLAIVVIKLSGKIEGGIFSFGFSTLAHFVFIISYFGIRPKHIVDVNYKYSFTDYRNYGLITTLMGLLFGIIYILVFKFLDHYGDAKVLLLCILVAHGAIDGFADYYECEYQRVNKLYMAGQALFFRIVFFAITLIAVLKITDNLVVAEISALIVEIIVFCVFNINRSNGIFNREEIHGNLPQLFFESLPLFLIVFLDMYMYTSSKFAIDIYLNDISSGFYNLIFMPSNIIYLVMNLFMKPLLTPLSNAYYNDKNDYIKLQVFIFIIGIIISSIFIFVTYFLGDIYIHFVNFLTGNIYQEFTPIAKKLLLVLICGGCFYTLTTPIYFSLIIEDKQRYLVIVYLIICIFSLVASYIFVKKFGLLGASYGFICTMIFLFILICILRVILNGKKQEQS